LIQMLCILPLLFGLICTSILVLERTKNYQSYVSTILLFVLLVVFMALVSFTNTFFAIARTDSIIDIFNTGTMRIAKSLLVPFKRLWMVLQWTVVSAVFSHLAGIQSSTAGVGATASGLVSFIFSTSWSLISFFVIPVIVCERLGFFETLKRSAQLARKYM